MEEKRRIDYGKGDGEPYFQKLEEKYDNMTDEEKAEVDAIEKKLNKIFGMDEEEE